MKCPSCGAEIENGRVCSFCGAQIPSELLRENEILNKAGCPKCGSSNVTFKRENQGEIRGKKSKEIIHKTVGYCKDCGYTWYPEVDSGKSYQFICRAIFNSGTTNNVTKKTTWKIKSGSSYASISSSGVFKAKKTSVQRTVKVFLSYTYKKRIAKATISVTIRPPASSFVWDASGSLEPMKCDGDSKAKRFEGTLADGDGAFAFSAAAGSTTGRLVVDGATEYSGMCEFSHHGSKIVVETESGQFVIQPGEDGTPVGGWLE